MPQANSTEIVTKIVDLLSPLTMEERSRIVRASMTLLGEEEQESAAGSSTHDGSESLLLSARSKIWMKQNDLSRDEIEQVFHISGEAIEVIAEVRGQHNKNKVHNCYILCGIAQFLLTGDPGFDDNAAKNLCQTSGCYDSNHSKYVKARGKEFTGSKEKGWTLTAPGLKRGAHLVKELSQQQ